MVGDARSEINIEMLAEIIPGHLGAVIGVEDQLGPVLDGEEVAGRLADVGGVGQEVNRAVAELRLQVEGEEDGALEVPVGGGVRVADGKELPALESGERGERGGGRGGDGDDDPPLGAEGGEGGRRGDGDRRDFGPGDVRVGELGGGINEPTTSNWTSGTSVKFEHIRPVNNDGRSISRDHDGFPLTCSGNLHDNMIILKQESGYADVKDNSFLRVNFQMEQGLPLVPKSLTFNRVKCTVSKGIKLGPTFLVTSLTGGSIVGDMAPYQAFAIGGLGSVRGYGEGAVGSGRLCLIGNCEYTVPLAKNLEGSLFMDRGSDLGSARHVPGNPALRQGKPGFGVGFGYGVHFNTDIGQIRVDYAMNAFSRKTFYFSINSGGAGS